ncbi:hypothetical protein ACR6C2_13425 [Streptomyces sp. INA 01156]
MHALARRRPADAREACATVPGPARDPAGDSLGDHDWLTVLSLTSVAVETGDTWLAERLRDRLAQGQGAGQPVCGLALRVLQIPLTAERELPALAADLQDAARRAEAAGWATGPCSRSTCGARPCCSASATRRARSGSSPAPVTGHGTSGLRPHSAGPCACGAPWCAAATRCPCWPSLSPCSGRAPTTWSWGGR